MDLSWYVKRLSRMSPREVVHRIRDEGVKLAWRAKLGRGSRSDRAMVGQTDFDPITDSGWQSAAAEDRLVAAAQELIEGNWKVFATVRHDMDPVPDWFLDPSSGLRAPAAGFSLSVDHRDPAKTGNVKFVWELSRHHHLTLLAAAYAATGDERFASTIDRHLRSWWRENPVLTGINWTSGIELGLRLISWTWIRRLLAGWDGARDLFEDNPVFIEQLYGHQRFLARLPSHGSSANNHLIAEAAGQFIASCAFPLFAASERWRRTSASTLRQEAVAQTFPSGLNRELASGYHGFVLELLLLAALEGEDAEQPLGDVVWATIVDMFDALVATMDGTMRPPRQGDDDEGIVLLVDDPSYDRWRSLVATGAALVGGGQWWPGTGEVDDVRTWVLRSFCQPSLPLLDRPLLRPDIFEDAGMVILRDVGSTPEEIWCRCDSGPHGFLAIAGHAHADALSVEVRLGGRDVLADPGTFCYHSEPEWREYFRSTRAHNTLELDGVDQSTAAGPFNWLKHATAEIVAVSGLEKGEVAEWTGHHDGYQRLGTPARHQRHVSLDRTKRILTIEDTVMCDGDHDGVLAYHLGPGIDCSLAGHAATLGWENDGQPRTAVLQLPATLEWKVVRGSLDPRGGWYSPAFGSKVPVATLYGGGVIAGNSTLTTFLAFSHPGGQTAASPNESRQGQEAS